MRFHALNKEEGQPLSIFISYAHSDEEFRVEIEKHLASLKRQGLISSWNDRKISAGSEWEGEIHQSLETADIVLLLISANFVASDYCWDVEMVAAMQRHASGKCRVIPIILRKIDDWQSSPFGILQALPTDGKPITSWEDRDEAYACVAQGIRTAISSPQHSCSTLEEVQWILTLEADLNKKSTRKVLP